MSPRLCSALLVFAVLSCGSIAWSQDDTDNDFKAVQVKLAETRVAMAELELKVAVQTNRKTPGLIPTVVIETLELSLARAKAQAAAAKGDGKATQAALEASADANVQIAKIRLKRLEDARVRSGEVDDSVIERAKLVVEIAELERASLLHLHQLPVEQQLRWQIERINASIDGISDRVIVLEDRR
jgi:hypothetical protein